MGICTSQSEEKKLDKKVQEMLKKANKEEDKKIKLLLLGAGESGKSTLLKQMILVYGKGFSVSDQKGFVSVINNNLATSMSTLVTEALNRDREADLNQVVSNCREFGQELATYDSEIFETLNKEQATKIKNLWECTAIQETFEARNEYTLTDSAKYFFDQVDTINQDDYLPTDDDILRSRVRTSGIIENKFLIEDKEFCVVDVGGQRSERRKWISCFEGVKAMIFVGVLSEYDLHLFEDEMTNRMVESLNLWSELTGSRYFFKTRFILFLNKRDVFEEKIKTKPLTTCPLFVDHDHSINNYDNGREAIKAMYLEMASKEEETIFTHFTCATDQNNMKIVMNAVKDTIIENALAEAGLIGAQYY